jgi:ribonucleoside-diphosphate reductase alpha chain
VFVTKRFKLNVETITELMELTPKFGYGQFGEIVFYRTYSRTKSDGSKESWNEVVIRVIEGIFSIRYDWYIKNHIHWDEDFWQIYARNMALSMFRMEWLPPGRGLWAIGTEYIYERGSMALNNCAYCVIGDQIDVDIMWMMDALMCGCGVGFSPIRNDNIEVLLPNEYHTVINEIEDSREGWVEST